MISTIAGGTLAEKMLLHIKFSVLCDGSMHSDGC